MALCAFSAVPRSTASIPCRQPQPMSLISIARRCASSSATPPRLDPTEQIKPAADLAEAVPVPTNNGLTYTKLRQGATWNAPAGGARQITSEDLERGFKRMCNPALGPAHHLFQMTWSPAF